MKNLITFLFYCLSVTALIAQTNGGFRLNLAASSQEETVLEYHLDGISQFPVQTPSGAAIIPVFDGGTPLLQSGMPDVGKFATAVRIPAKGNMVVEIISSNYEEFYNIEMAPSKGNLKRNTDPASVPYKYNSAYDQDAFFPGELASLNEPFVMRNARGQALWLFPVQYNPVSKVMRIYHDITVKLSPAGGSGANELRNKTIPPSAAFDQIFDKIFINNSAFSSRSSNLNPDKMLVIAKDEFIPALEPLLTWKRQMGIHTTVVPVSEIGASDETTVYNFVKDYYDNNGISYLLLVGDENDINPQMRPSGGTNYSCDNCFGYMDGTDHLPEVFVGRLNAETVEQLQIMVIRNLDYEVTPLVDTSANWTATAMASCSNEGVGIGDDNQADWQQGNEWKTTHLADGYEKVWEFYDGNHAADSPTPGDESADLPGNPINTQLVQLMNNRGVSLYNYTGHGWEQGLASGNFNTSAVAQLRNTHRYPIIIAVACCAGNFTNNGGGDCLGEAVQRAGDPVAGEAWGSIAGFFSSDFQSWAPPMEGQDGMNQYLVDADGIDLFPHIGPMAAFGNALMIIAYDNGGEVMADFWNPFLEPTTVPRTRAAQDLAAAHPASLYIGSTSLSVSCDVEGALVSLYWQGQTLAVATVENGAASLDFPALNDVAELTVTVTQFNYKPYQGTIAVTPSGGPFVVDDLIQIDDALGNSDLKADYGENITVHLQLLNVGVELANATSATLTTADDNVVITDGEEMFGDIPDSSSVLSNNAFAFTVNDDVVDGHIVTFNLHIQFNDTLGYDKAVFVKLNAPDLLATTFILDDAQGGNNNKRLESGETATITILNTNQGHSLSGPATGVLISDSPYLTISPAVDLGALDPVTGSAVATFTVTVDNDAPMVSPANFHYEVSAGNYGDAADYTDFVINAIVEDFETHNFNSFDWLMDDDKPWTITTIQTYNGQYCSRSGTITHNQKTTMKVTLDVTADGTVSFARRVSSEESYDFLRFFIDDVEIDAWSGDQPWEEVSYPVSPGIHTFTWTYEKDDNTSSGSDRAWLDDILLPPNQVFVAAQTPSNFASRAVIYPNPSRGEATLQLELSTDQSVQVNIYDNLGRLIQVLQPQTMRSAGMHFIPVRMESATPGVYYFSIQSAEGTHMLKWVKQD